MKQRYLHFILGILLLMSVVSCTKDGPYTHYKPVSSYEGSVYDYLKKQPEHFEQLLFVLDKAGLSKVLKQDSITFFAPTDQSLMAAMNRYNVFRKSQNLSPVTIADIDSSSWRYIMAPYLIPGLWPGKRFKAQDGLTMRTLAMRNMHGKLVSHNASGAEKLGTETIQFSYLNGSRFTKDWLSTYVTTPDIHAKNGIIHLLESRHVVGFNYFNDKAKEPQNIYSEKKCFAWGTITLPNTNVRIWASRVKSLRAVGENSVETEAADQLDNGYLMELVINDNDSVTVKPAPNSVNLSIENNGPCYFDQETLTFILNYRYMEDDGYRTIAENIKYVAQ